MQSQIQVILNRASQPKIDGKITLSEIESIVKCGLTAPDHRSLRPWRFILCDDGDLETLMNRIDSFKERPEVETTEIDSIKIRIRKLKDAAPHIIICLLELDRRGAVPEIEQVLSEGAAIQNMLIAAEALGHNGFWRTGKLAYDKLFAESLGLDDNVLVCGFLSLGHLSGAVHRVSRSRPNIDDHFHNLGSFLARAQG